LKYCGKTVPLVEHLKEAITL